MNLLLDRRQPLLSESIALERAIVETLTYFDVFDYPLRPSELHRYLHGLHATSASLERVLRSSLLTNQIDSRDGYIFLRSRGLTVTLREQRRIRYMRIAPRIAAYGRILSRLPFIRMVALTGSSAMQNGDGTADLDFLLVTAPDRLWLARAFAILIGRWTALSNHVLCPNVILSERALHWSDQDLYAAHELTQMVPLAGGQVYTRLRAANPWALAYLPNADHSPSDALIPDTGSPQQRLLEGALGGAFGRRLEKWEMRRKITRLTRQNTPGAETAFNADICQGNFNRHGALTRHAFQERLDALGLESPVPLLVPELVTRDTRAAG